MVPFQWPQWLVVDVTARTIEQMSRQRLEQMLAR